MLIAATSSGLSSSDAAAMFSSACCREPVPGMGRICGEMASSQASTTWCCVTPCRSAATATGTFRPDSWIGAQGRNTSCSCSHRSMSGSDLRSDTLYLFWMDTIGTIGCASRSWASDTLEIPTCRILPSSLSSAIAPIDSASGTAGSGRWNW